MAPRMSRYSRPKTQPPESLIEFLCTKFSYGDHDQWRDFIAKGYVDVRPDPRRRRREPTDDTTNASYGLITPEMILQQGDHILFDPPQALEPDVDVTNITALLDDPFVLVCVKNGEIPVAEGGRYGKNTLCSVMTARVERPASTSDCAAAEPEAPRVSQRSRNASESTFSLFPVHRLDKETSGIVILAKDASTAAHLSEQFHNKDVEPQDHLSKGSACIKEYVAVVEGVMSPQLMSSWCDSDVAHMRLDVKDSFIGSSPLRALYRLESDQVDVISVTARIGFAAEGQAVPDDDDDGKGRSKSFAKLFMKVFPSNTSTGKSARTDLTVLAIDSSRNLSLVALRLFTGRTHQIRLHCAHVGFPIVGDKMYTTTTPSVPGGSRCVEADTYLARTRGEVATVFCGKWHVRRHLLHAARLRIECPVGEATVPRDFYSNPAEWFARDSAPIGEEDCQLSLVDGNDSALQGAAHLTRCLFA